AGVFGERTMTGHAPTTDPTFDRLVDDLIARLHAGGAVDWSAVEREHPAHADRLRSLAPALAALGELSQAGDSAVSGVAPTAGAADDLTAGVLGDVRIL